MLKLTRRINEILVLHDYHGIIAEIIIADILGHQVRLAINASPEIIIDRKEIYLKKTAGKENIND